MAVEDKPTVPILTSLNDVYDPSIRARQELRFSSIHDAFGERYGTDPDFYVRCPGRVNLIGEHIDYCGFSVFPMAVDRDIVVAVSKNERSELRLANTNEQYRPSEERLESAQEGYVNIDPTIHEWTNYFKCGVRGASEHMKLESGVGMNCLVSGTVPSGAGLSSSSALVCSSVLATLAVNWVELSKTDVTKIAIRSERYVGINSLGGMDQTASIFSELDHILHIEFEPRLFPTLVPFPVTNPRMTFVVADTLVVSDKHVSAPACYNLRVVETRAAALALARSLGLTSESSDGLQTLRQVSDAYFLSKSSKNEQAAHSVGMWRQRLEEMLGFVDMFLTQKDGYSKEDMAEACGLEVAEFEKRYMKQFAVRAETFQLYRRARHVYSEALRVYRFRDECEKAAHGDDASSETILEELGSLMTQSQNSCRDDFACSCPEIDDLVAKCLNAGAVGSRLTGAGWGGCTVSLVPESIVDEFIRTVKDTYYRPRGFIDPSVLDTAIFTSRPGNGAVIIKTSETPCV